MSTFASMPPNDEPPIFEEDCNEISNVCQSKTTSVKEPRIWLPVEGMIFGWAIAEIVSQLFLPRLRPLILLVFLPALLMIILLTILLKRLYTSLPCRSPALKFPRQHLVNHSEFPTLLCRLLISLNPFFADTVQTLGVVGVSLRIALYACTLHLAISWIHSYYPYVRWKPSVTGKPFSSPTYRQSVAASLSLIRDMFTRKLPPKFKIICISTLLLAAPLGLLPVTLYLSTVYSETQTTASAASSFVDVRYDSLFRNSSDSFSIPTVYTSFDQFDVACTSSLRMNFTSQYIRDTVHFFASEGVLQSHSDDEIIVYDELDESIHEAIDFPNPNAADVYNFEATVMGEASPREIGVQCTLTMAEPEATDIAKQGIQRQDDATVMYAGMESSIGSHFEATFSSCMQCLLDGNTKNANSCKHSCSNTRIDKGGGVMMEYAQDVVNEALNPRWSRFSIDRFDTKSLHGKRAKPYVDWKFIGQCVMTGALVICSLPLLFGHNIFSLKFIPWSIAPASGRSDLTGKEMHWGKVQQSRTVIAEPLPKNTMLQTNALTPSTADEHVAHKSYPNVIEAPIEVSHTPKVIAEVGSWANSSSDDGQSKIENRNSSVRKTHHKYEYVNIKVNGFVVMSDAYLSPLQNWDDTGAMLNSKDLGQAKNASTLLSDTLTKTRLKADSLEQFQDLTTRDPSSSGSSGQHQTSRSSGSTIFSASNRSHASTNSSCSGPGDIHPTGKQRSLSKAKSYRSPQNRITKRKRSGRSLGSEGDESDDEPDANSDKIKSPDNGGSDLLFACPFWKWQPHRHQDCYRKVLRGIPELKQHLLRIHKAPDCYCFECHLDLEHEEAYEAHLRTNQCSPGIYTGPGLMRRHMLAFVKKRHPGRKPADAWNDIFKVLFPGFPLPESPYMIEEDPGCVEQVSTLLRVLSPGTLQQVLADLQRSRRESLLPPQTDRIVSQALQSCSLPSSSDTSSLSDGQTIGSTSTSPQRQHLGMPTYGEVDDVMTPGGFSHSNDVYGGHEGYETIPQFGYDFVPPTGYSSSDWNTASQWDQHIETPSSSNQHDFVGSSHTVQPTVHASQSPLPALPHDWAINQYISPSWLVPDPTRRRSMPRQNQ